MYHAVIRKVSQASMQSGLMQKNQANTEPNDVPVDYQYNSTGHGN